MNRYSAGMIAGLVATIVLSLLMLMKGAMGLMPDLNVIKMLTAMAHQRVGTPATPLVGWMMHFVIGTIAWGLLFAALNNKLPTSPVGWADAGSPTSFTPRIPEHKGCRLQPARRGAFWA